MNLRLVLLGLEVFALGYLPGSIPFGYLVGQARGVDIRTVGSGNIGATNVFRTLGKGPGIFTFLCDALKGVLAVQIGVQMVSRHPIFESLRHMDYELITPAMGGILAAAGCILGHNFPLWLGFKGGKGVATSAGVIVGMLPLATLIVAAIWALVFYTSRYVSLASICAALALPIVVFALMLLRLLEGWSYFYFALAAALLVVWRHRANIDRLIHGTELRFGRKPPAPDEPDAPHVP